MMKNQLLKLSVGIFAACSLAVPVDLEAAPKVTASLDSAYLLMGRQTTVHLETAVPENTADIQLLLPSDTLTANVEIISVTSDTSAIGNGMLQLRHDIIIQSFDSGLYALPPVRMVIDKDTALSNHLILKVVPVDVDSLQGKIHDYAPVAEPPHKFFDFIPQNVFNWIWWVIGAVVLLAILGAGLYYYRKRKKMPSKKAVRIVPPYDQAIGELNHLREEHLCEQGREREFYTRLTEILRVYLDRRFGISAMEMTSQEILRALSDNQETRWSRAQIEQVLSMADFVKFAKMRPLPDDNIKTFRTVYDFVEATKPVEKPAEDEAKQASADTPINNAPKKD